MKQKFNDMVFYFPIWWIVLLLAIAFFFALFSPPNKKLYQANCLTGTYQVYRKEHSYYLQENDEEFLPHGNCVFVETKR